MQQVPRRPFQLRPEVQRREQRSDGEDFLHELNSRHGCDCWMPSLRWDSSH